MTEILFIYINTDLQPGHSLVLTGDGNMVKKEEQRSWHALTELSKGRHVYMIISGEIITCHQIELPSIKHADKLIPNILEEKLISDIEKVHFAWHEIHGPIYTIEKSLMDKLLQHCHTHHIQPTKIIPETVVNEDNAAYLAPDHFVYAHEKNHGVLPLPIPAPFTSLTHQLNCHSFTDSGQSELAIQSPHQQSYLLYLSLAIQTQPGCNLLQGTYTRKQHQTQLKRRISIALPFVMLILSFFALLLKSNMLHHELNGIETKNFAIYKKFFPDASRMISPRFRIQQKLKSQQSQSNNIEVLTLLNAVSPVLSRWPNLTIIGFDYQSNSLSLQFKINNFEQLEALTAKLQSTSAISIEQTSARSNKGSIDVTWRIQA